MQLSLVGLSHHTAPVEVRERLHFPEKDIPPALHAVRERPGVGEALFFSTCNRVEVLARLEDGLEALPLLADFQATTRRVAPESFRSYLYHHSQRDAVRHVFRVAASLDSMILGEPQVLGQLKAAYATARAVGTVGSVLDEVLTHAFAVAKKVRSETGIAASAVSVSYAAVELARKIFGSLEGRNVFVIGAGKMSELAARHLLHSGAQAIFRYHPHGRAGEGARQAVARPRHPVRRPAEPRGPGLHHLELHRLPALHHQEGGRRPLPGRAQEPADVLHRHRRAPRHRPGAQQPGQHRSEE